MKESATRLYHCWENMKQRTKRRGDLCWIYPAWNKFIFFKEWALSHGYTPERVLCREGDCGGYTPDNVRWDSSDNNKKECFSKSWRFLDPSGAVVEIHNLNQFCKKHNLRAGCMHRVSTGKQTHHKQWRVYGKST